MPHASIHVCCVTNWKPASAASNSASIQMLMAPVATLASRAISLTSSGRRLPVRATASAPTTGTRIRAVRIGNPTEDDVLHYRIPRTTTNQTSSPTTPRPMIAA